MKQTARRSTGGMAPRPALAIAADRAVVGYLQRVLEEKSAPGQRKMQGNCCGKLSW